MAHWKRVASRVVLNMEVLMAQRMRLNGLRNYEKGSGFIETAILLPTMLLMCCGTMDFARVVYAGIEVANAARAGVQFGALTPGNSGNTDGMVQAAKNDAADLGSGVTATARNFCECVGGTGEVACSTTTCGSTPSGYVSVTANYTFNTLLHWPGLPQTVTLSRTAKIRVQ
jgi:Flp pilus assembly protein TadG